MERTLDMHIVTCGTREYEGLVVIILCVYSEPTIVNQLTSKSAAGSSKLLN